jgi:hypothetical protein
MKANLRGSVTPAQVNLLAKIRGLSYDDVQNSTKEHSGHSFSRGMIDYAAGTNFSQFIRTAMNDTTDNVHVLIDLGSKF